MTASHAVNCLSTSAVEVPKSESKEIKPDSRSYQLTHDYLVPALRRWLTQVNITQADCVQRFQFSMDGGNCLKESKRFFDRHCEHTRDVFFFVFDL